MSRAMIFAERAVDYVHNTVRIKTGNRYEGVNRLQSEKAQTNETVDDCRSFAREKFVELKKTQQDVRESDVRSQVAKFRLCGNCTEQSAIAFEWLRRQGETGIAWMAFPNHNHMFTLLGLTAEPAKLASFRVDVPPADWGPNAVVCDPWYHDWFLVRLDWTRKLRRILLETTGKLIPNGELFTLKCRAYV